MIKKVLLSILICGLGAVVVPAAQLDPLFMDHMVLQRGKAIPVFGTAEPGETVTVTFGGQTQRTVASERGRWHLSLDPLSASFKPQELNVHSSTGTRHASIRDVLIGDVWLCTGQSNMDSAVKQYEELAEKLKNTENPMIRLFSVRMTMKKEPQNQLMGEAIFRQSWLPLDPRSLAEFSAVGISFGLKMQAALDVPIGLVESAVGATAIEPWMPAETLAELGQPYTPMVVANNPSVEARNQPSELYNGMIHPLLPMKYKGIIWYQGESNARACQYYGESFKAMISVWRERLRDPELPFYFAQLSAYGRVPDKIWVHLREAQDEALELPHTGRIVITDLGEYNWIHPEDKAPVGERFAAIALNDMGVRPFAGFPEYKAMKQQRDHIAIAFSNAGEGLRTQRVVMNKIKGEPIRKDPQAFIVEADTLQGFEIAGSDGIYVKADAKITGKDTVDVWSPEVTNPVAVRYAWDNLPLCNLFNSEGMPASLFRTNKKL